MRFARLLVQVFVAVVCFLAGCLLSLFVLMRLFSPEPDCTAPCDGSAYAAVGLTLLVGPFVGVFLAIRGVRLVSKRLHDKRAPTT